MNIKHSVRFWYGAGFILLLAIEVVIALYVRDDFIRPYLGDLLVTVLLCCFVRIFFPCGIKRLPLWVFLFASLVETAQFFNWISLLGLENNMFFKTLLGSTFSAADILCYGVGCLLFFVTEVGIKRCCKRKVISV